MAGTSRTSSTNMVIEDEVMISMQAVNKWYGDFHVLKDINLTVNKGERIVVCGPSGSGKSTLIRCLNRLEEHQAGTIKVQGIEINNDLKNYIRGLYENYFPKIYEFIMSSKSIAFNFKENIYPQWWVVFL